jgi:hypothetical protein
MTSKPTGRWLVVFLPAGVLVLRPRISERLVQALRGVGLYFANLISVGADSTTRHLLVIALLLPAGSLLIVLSAAIALRLAWRRGLDVTDA